MGITDQIATDTLVFLDDFAETVTYEGIQIRAVVQIGANMSKGNTFTSEGQSSRAEIWLSAQDVTTPAEGDRVELENGDVWRVARVLESDAAMHRLECLGSESVFG